MTLNELNDNWDASEYDAETYYFHEDDCGIGSVAYMYRKDDNELIEMRIIKTICWSDSPSLYEQLLQTEDVLLDGEAELNADTSCEFITNDDCYLVWFRYA